MRIYTRGGDDGSTGLFGGARVSKADPRVDAYGTVDELNAVLGWARAAGLPESIDADLARIQEDCFRLGALLASAPGADPGIVPIDAGDVERLEAAIDGLTGELEPLRAFILPGGSEGGSRLHVARTVSRRAERGVVALVAAEDAGIDPFALQWLNRLSDLLFVQARWVNAQASRPEQTWQPSKER